MEIFTNSFELPLKEIEQALLSRAIPKVYAQVVIYLRLLPTAAQEVQLQIEYRDTTRPSVTKDEVPIIPSNERYNQVRAVLSERARDLRVFCPVSKIIGTFQDGKLSAFDIVKVEEKFV